MATFAKAVLELTTDQAAFNRGLDDAEKKLGGLEGRFGSIGRSLQAFGASTTQLGTSLSLGLTAPIVGLVGGLTGLAASAASTGDTIAKSARTAGLSAQSYQEISYSLQHLAQVSEDEVTRGFGKLTTSIGEASKGTASYVGALSKLGFSQSEIASGTIETEDAFNRVIAAMQQAKSPAEAAALAGDLLGDRLGPKLAGALREGGGSVDALRQQFRDLGLGMDAAALASSEKFQDALSDLRQSFAAVARDLGSAVLPLLTDELIPFLQTSVVPMIRRVTDTVAGIVRGFMALPGPVQGAIGVLTGLLAAAGPVLVVVGTLASAMGALVPFLAAGTTQAALLSSAMSGLGTALAAAAVAAAGWQVGKWIGEVTGLTGAIEKLTVKAMGWADTSVPLEQQQRVINAAISQGAAASISFADALEYLKQKAAEHRAEWDQAAIAEQHATSAREGLAAALADAEHQIQREIQATGLSVGELTRSLAKNESAFQTWATTNGLSAQTVAFLKTQLDAQHAAQQKAEAAAKAHEAQVEKERAALERLGFTTEHSVNAKLAELAQIQATAAREGVPAADVARKLEGEYVALAYGAAQAGVDVTKVNAALRELRGLLPEIPPLDSIVVSSDATNLIAQFGVDLDLTAMKGEVDAKRLTDAFGVFGLSTQDSLQRTAAEARAAYQVMLDSGTATAEQLRVAREQVVEAERAAAGETTRVWKNDLVPAVIDAGRAMKDGIVGHLSGMLRGAESFKDGFVGIWDSIKRGVFSIFDTILKGFVDNLLGGLLNSMKGASGGLGGGISGLFKGLFGGGAGAAAGGAAAGGLFAGLGSSLLSGGLAGLAMGGVSALVSGIAGLFKGNETKGSREDFAKSLGFGSLDALFMKLNQASEASGGSDTRGWQLVDQALNRIGKGDTAANQQWMQQVSALLDEVQAKANETAIVVDQGLNAELSSGTAEAAAVGADAVDEQHQRIQQAEARLAVTMEQAANARTDQEREVLDRLVTMYRTELDQLKADVEDQATTMADTVQEALVDTFDSAAIDPKLETLKQKTHALADELQDALSQVKLDIPVGFDIGTGPALMPAETRPLPSFDNRPLEAVTGHGFAELHRGDVVGVPKKGFGRTVVLETVNIQALDARTFEHWLSFGPGGSALLEGFAKALQRHGLA